MREGVGGAADEQFVLTALGEQRLGRTLLLALLRAGVPLEQSFATALAISRIGGLLCDVLRRLVGDLLPDLGNAVTRRAPRAFGLA